VKLFMTGITLVELWAPPSFETLPVRLSGQSRSDKTEILQPTDLPTAGREQRNQLNPLPPPEPPSDEG
jgi:hypothetical protein